MTDDFGDLADGWRTGRPRRRKRIGAVTRVDFGDEKRHRLPLSSLANRRAGGGVELVRRAEKARQEWAGPTRRTGVGASWVMHSLQP
jgi:hypothetical protein